MMKDRSYKIAAFLTSMVLMMAPSLAVANASPPTTVNGRWKPLLPIVFTNPRYTGLTVHLDCNLQGMFDGGNIEGYFTQDFKITLHYDDLEKVATCREKGPNNLKAWPKPITYEFTSYVRTVNDAKVLGKSGSFTMKIQATGHGMPVMHGTTGYDLYGTWRIVKGSGGLENLHGQGAWWHNDETAKDYDFHMYSGKVHIDP